MKVRLPHLAAAPAALIALAVLPVIASARPAPEWKDDYARPAQFSVVAEEEVPIEMRDGIRLRANVYRPDEPGRYPVLITQTPYNKNILFGGASSYLVERGYVHVVVDVRGTGTSQGAWDSFGPAEQRDGFEVVNWARRQQWSNGKSGLVGPSYLAITSLYTAAQRPKGLKAMFVNVPLADGYRDITFSGGQVNVAFIPLWLGLVTGGSIVPGTSGLEEDYPDRLINGLVENLTTLVGHVAGAVNFQARTVVDATTGGDVAYDGPFWKTRSPLEVVDKIRVPSFIVGGLDDIFQRGEPLLYERLKQRVPARLLIGPWTHIEGSMGAGLADAGLPPLEHMQLRWFDRYLKGIKRTKVGKIPRSTYWQAGRGGYETYRDWPDPRIRAETWYLREGRGLTRDRPAAGENGQTVLQNPLSGICTRSTSQWTAGLGGSIPCTERNNLNENLDATWTSAPFERPLKFQGPIAANLWVVPSSRDAVLSVRVTDVGPDGTSKELSTGWLAGSFREVDRRRSRMLGGKVIQPWHPFTRTSAKPLEPGKPYRLAVEIFPTNAVLERGHRLRVSVGGADFPHALPPLGQSLRSLAGRVRILNDAEHRSHLVVPKLGSCKTKCGSKPLPHLLRSKLR